MFMLLPSTNRETPEARLARSRLYLVAFWALWATTQLALLNPSGSEVGRGALLPMLASLAVLSAATAVWLRRTASPSSRVAARPASDRVGTEGQLLAQIQQELSRTRQAHQSVGVLVVDVMLLREPSGSRDQDRRRAMQVAEELIKQSFESSPAIFGVGPQRLAVVLSDAITLIGLKDFSDQLLAGSKARRRTEEAPGWFRLNIGVAVNNRSGSSPKTLLASARIAADRAETLGTGCYFAVDGLPW